MSDLDRNALTCTPCWPIECPECASALFGPDLTIGATSQMWICPRCLTPIEEIGVVDPQAWSRRMHAESILGRPLEPSERPGRIIAAAEATAAARFARLLEGATR